MIKNLSLKLLVFVLLLSACNSNSGPDTVPAIDPDAGKSYFFLEEGRFREYDVYEIRYLAVDMSDTMTYQLREEVKESFTNVNGEVSHIIHRLVRPDDTQEWELDSVWSARVEADRAVSVENNVPIVKIEFPSVVERKWNGNLLNTRQDDEFEVVTFNPAQDETNTTLFTVPSIPGDNRVTPTFVEVLVIEQNNDEDNITFRDIRTEVYKDSVGLVFKSYDVVKICSRPECLGQEIVESGRFYREVLVAEGSIDD